MSCVFVDFDFDSARGAEGLQLGNGHAVVEEGRGSLSMEVEKRDFGMLDMAGFAGTVGVEREGTDEEGLVLLIAGEGGRWRGFWCGLASGEVGGSAAWCVDPHERMCEVVHVAIVARRTEVIVFAHSAFVTRTRKDCHLQKSQEQLCSDRGSGCGVGERWIDSAEMDSVVNGDRHSLSGARSQAVQ